jgi:ribosome-associated translation inhibitor RaiA
MTQFVAAAHEQIAAEHRQWLAAAQNVQPAIDKLEDTLAKLKQRPRDSQAVAAKVPE